MLATGKMAWRSAALLLGVGSLFWMYYFVRLLIVTHMLARVPSAGWGAYVGALTFPVLSIALGAVSRWAFRRSHEGERTIGA